MKTVKRRSHELRTRLFAVKYVPMWEFVLQIVAYVVTMIGVIIVPLGLGLTSIALLLIIGSLAGAITVTLEKKLGAPESYQAVTLVGRMREQTLIYRVLTNVALGSSAILTIIQLVGML